jgi:hypothetical protein
VSDFVDECRREWRRLGVPDPVANEMAADLTADLEEAEAEGASPEDVLGNSAFDPRRFAAAWAGARGVTGSPIPDRPIPDRPPFWRAPVAIAGAALLGVLTFGAGLVLLVGFRRGSFAVATRRIVAGPGPVRIFPRVPNRISVPGPLGPFVGTQISGDHPIALILLIVVIAGIGLLGFLYWSLWSGPRRYRRRQEPGSSTWN